MLWLRCKQSAKTVPESVQNQGEMLFEVTSELHWVALGAQNGSRLKKKRKMDFRPLPFGFLFETFPADNLEKTIPDLSFF